MSKKNVAIFGVGIIGVGRLKEGIPVLVEILKELSHHFNITIYSFLPVDKSKVPEKIRVRSIPFKMNARLRFLYLGWWFFTDHFRSKYHVLHAQSALPGGAMAYYINKIVRIPWVITLIGGEVEAMPEIPFGDLLKKEREKLTLKVCHRADLITVMSGYQADSVSRNLNINTQITVLTYAPKASVYYNKKISAPVRLLHVANHYPVKNHDMLLALMKNLVGRIDCELIIVGSYYDDKFDKKVNDLGLEKHIILKGPVAHSDMIHYYRKAHILLHTSWYEGLPTVAFEAMAHGTVVCGTQVGIISDLANNCCLVVEPGDHITLANKVIEVIQNPLLYEQLRSKSHQWAKEHDQSYYINRISQLYDQLAESISRVS